MPIGIFFWVLVIVGVVFGILDTRVDPNNHRWGYATWIVILATTILLGIKVFGNPIQ